MNRKKMIIVSITGIIIVLLSLIGLTFAYYLTQITGNKNEKSISISTAKLKLVYGNDDGSIIGLNEKILPGKTFSAKTFTVTNNGNKTIDAYAVILDNVSITDIRSGNAVALNSTRDKDNDFDLVITRTDLGENNIVYNNVLPEQNAILVTTSIKPGETHSYSAVLTYQETDQDQSDDMNKNITGRFNIIDTEDTAIIEGKVTNTKDAKYYVQTNSIKRTSYIDVNGNYKIFGLEAGNHTVKLCEITDENCATPVITKNLQVTTGEETNANNTTGEITIKDNYKVATININADENSVEIEENIGFNNPYNIGTLADHIINNAMNPVGSKSTTFTIPTELPTTVAQEVSGASEKILSYTNEDSGVSYYYRGNVEDNYVNFAGMCWRIVRVNNDGSVKIILEDQYTTCNDNIDNDGEGTADHKYTGNWVINTGVYGYTPKVFNSGENPKNTMTYLVPTYYKEKSMVKAFYNFQTINLKDYIDKLKSENWCLNDNVYASDNITPLEKDDYSVHRHYDAYVRLYEKTTKEPTLKCNGTELSNFANVTNVSSELPMYVGTLIADEIVYAGSTTFKSNPNTYLVNKYQKENELFFWTLTPLRFLGYDDVVFRMAHNGTLGSYHVYGDVSFRPVVSLASNILATTNNDTTTYGEPGTINNPYVIN